MMMMMLRMMKNYFCGMVDWRKAFSLISSRNHCQTSSSSRISDTPRAGFEPAQNLSPGLVEWSCAVLITTTPRHRKYVFGLDFRVTFPISASFGIQILFLNFNKTLFDLRWLCNRFLRCIYLTADARLKQVTFQSALVNLFSFCKLETVIGTTLLSLHVINSINNSPSNTLKT